MREGMTLAEREEFKRRLRQKLGQSSTSSPNEPAPMQVYNSAQQAMDADNAIGAAYALTLQNLDYLANDFIFQKLLEPANHQFLPPLLTINDNQILIRDLDDPSQFVQHFIWSRTPIQAAAIFCRDVSDISMASSAAEEFHKKWALVSANSGILDSILKMVIDPEMNNLALCLCLVDQAIQMHDGLYQAQEISGGHWIAVNIKKNVDLSSAAIIDIGIADSLDGEARANHAAQYLRVFEAIQFVLGELEMHLDFIKSISEVFSNNQAYAGMLDSFVQAARISQTRIYNIKCSQQSGDTCGYHAVYNAVGMYNSATLQLLSENPNGLKQDETSIASFIAQSRQKLVAIFGEKPVLQDVAPVVGAKRKRNPKENPKRKKPSTQERQELPAQQESASVSDLESQLLQFLEEKKIKLDDIRKFLSQPNSITSEKLLRLQKLGFRARNVSSINPAIFRGLNLLLADQTLANIELLLAKSDEEVVLSDGAKYRGLGFTATNLSSILHGSRAQAAAVINALVEPQNLDKIRALLTPVDDVAYSYQDPQGQTIEVHGLGFTATNLSSILNGSGARAEEKLAEIFKIAELFDEDHRHLTKAIIGKAGIRYDVASAIMTASEGQNPDLFLAVFCRLKTKKPMRTMNFKEIKPLCDSIVSCIKEAAPMPLFHLSAQQVNEFFTTAQQEEEQSQMGDVESNIKLIMASIRHPNTSITTVSEVSGLQPHLQETLPTF